LNYLNDLNDLNDLNNLNDLNYLGHAEELITRMTKVWFLEEVRGQNLIHIKF